MHINPLSRAPSLMLLMQSDSIGIPLVWKWPATSLQRAALALLFSLVCQPLELSLTTQTLAVDVLLPATAMMTSLWQTYQLMSMFQALCISLKHTHS